MKFLLYMLITTANWIAISYCKSPIAYRVETSSKSKGACEAEAYFKNITRPVDASINDFPYHVSIRNSGMEHLCSGAIIKSNIVLTTADCVCNSKSSQNKFKVVSQTTVLTAAANTKEVMSVTCHPLFYKTTDNNAFNLAKITIKGTFKEGSAQEWIRISNVSPTPDTAYHMTGWPIGITNKNHILYNVKTLQVLKIRSIAPNVCKLNNAGVYNESYTCGFSQFSCGYFGEEPLGDKGSPLIHKQSARLFGILSFVRPNVQTAFYIFNDLSQHLSFINEYK